VRRNTFQIGVRVPDLEFRIGGLGFGVQVVSFQFPVFDFRVEGFGERLEAGANCEVDP
jgi:hypothetical protein